MQWALPPAKRWNYLSTPTFRQTWERYNREIDQRIERAGDEEIAVEAARIHSETWKEFELARLRLETNGHDPGLEPCQMALENWRPISRYFFFLKVGIYSVYYRRVDGEKPLAVALLLFSDYERPKILREALNDAERT